MTFAHPLWFWAGALLPLLLALFFRNEVRRKKLLQKLVAARLQERLAGSVSVAKRRCRFLLLLLGLAGVIAALAQPRLGYTWEESKRKGRDVLIAIDCSRSMLATDLAPNRLARAKLAAQDFIGQLGGDRVGLIAFAGSAFLQAPLTIDYSAVLNSLAELDTEIIPRGGTDIAAAVKTAVEAFGKGESDSRCLVIFTDGEELDADGIKAAEGQNGIMRIFTVGLGSGEGSIIPVPGRSGGTEFVKDASGQIVKSRLDEERLRKIAEVTGGFYLPLHSGPAEMQQLVRDGLGTMKEQEIDAKMSRRPIERYQWPLAAGMLCLAASMLIGERKRAARRTVAVAALMLLAPLSAEAKNAGIEAYEREDFKGAGEQFSQQLRRMPESEALHFNSGAAAYKAGDFGKALESFAKAVTSPDPVLREKAEYNLGNTLFRRGAALKDKQPKIKEWQNALQHYDQALKADPQDGNAKFNRELVQKLIEELEKEPPKPDEQKKKEDKKDEQKKDDKDQKQDQQKDQKKDGQKPDEQPKEGDKKESKDQSQKSPGDQNQTEKQPGDKGDAGQEQDGKEDAPQPQKGDKGDPGEEKKDDPTKPGEQSQQAKNEPGKQEQPAPGEPEKKRSGDIQPQNAQAPSEADAQAAEEALAAQEGKMTEQQAANLLESLKSEDDRVQLLERKRGGRVLRDW